MTTLLAIATAIALSALTVSQPASAAPAQSDEIGPSGVTTSDPRAEHSAPSPTSGGGSGKAVDLLLRMQDKPQLYDRGADASVPSANRRAGEQAPPRDEAAKVSPLPSSLSDLKKLVVGAQSPAANEAPRNDTPSEGNQRPEGSPTSRPTPLAGLPSQDGAPAPRLSSHPMIRFIRENRGLTVLMVVGIAIAVWLTATVSIRRGR